MSPRISCNLMFKSISFFVSVWLDMTLSDTSLRCSRKKSSFSVCWSHAHVGWAFFLEERSNTLRSAHTRLIQCSRNFRLEECLRVSTLWECVEILAGCKIASPLPPTWGEGRGEGGGCKGDWILQIWYLIQSAWDLNMELGYLYCCEGFLGREIISI